MRQPAVRPQAAARIEFARLARSDSLVHRARHARQIAALALEVLVLAALLSLFFIRVPEISGHSMEPQLAAGDHVLINTLAFDARIGPWRIAHIRDVQHGEIVAFSHVAGGRREIYLKRAIGLSGDVVDLRHGVVYLNGVPLAESYAIRKDGTTLGAQTVSARHVYVLGDNRADSNDSRTFGQVPTDEIIGRAALLCWPPGRAKRIR